MDEFTEILFCLGRKFRQSSLITLLVYVSMYGFRNAMRPLQHLLWIPTFVSRAEVRARRIRSVCPVEGDKTSVGLAHQYLPKHFDAVICMLTKMVLFRLSPVLVNGFVVLDVCPLSQYIETVEVVEHLERGHVAGASVLFVQLNLCF
jgi:hypothetical protein